MEIVDVEEVKRRLNMFLNDQDLVNEYIENYGPHIDMKKIKELKDVKEIRLNKLKPDIGELPLYVVMVKCPVCNQERIPCYELKAKSQQITLNKFLVPQYEGTSEFKSYDYTYSAVTVCPKCLLASPDKRDFSRMSSANNSIIKSQLTSTTITLIKDKTDARKELIKATNYADYFKNPRLDGPAIASYKLAMERAKIEAELELPYAYYKLGSYALRIANIMKEVHKDNTEILTEALNYFESAFKTSTCPQEEIEMQVIYLIVALNIKLGDFTKANSYISVFSSLHSDRVLKMKEDPKLNTVFIDRWSDKAKFLWEDRETPDLFDD